MSDLRWYMHRLRRMPVAELPYRFEHWAKKKHDKYSVLHASNRPAFSYRASRIDLSGAEAIFPDLRTRLVTSAESMLNHQFNVFGIERDFGDPIDWHLDPKTGNQWPLAFWGDIDYRDGRAIGGIKFAWELNRLHHLPVLAMAFQMTQERRYREGLFAELQSWMDGNPYPRGINWVSGIEIAIRIVNVVFSLRLLGDESLTVREQRMLRRFVSLSGRHLCRYRSRYSSCANHAVAEALGLFAAGLCFPGLEGAGQWKKLGRDTLEYEITRQIHPDGSSFEHSVPYLQFVSELFLTYRLLCQDYGEPCGERVSGRLQAAFEFMSSVTDANGNYPCIGDGDDGCLLRLNLTGQSNLASLLNIGAILFDNPAWILERADYDLMTLCLLGGVSRGRWEQLRRRARGREPGVQSLPDAGFVVVRDTNDILLVGNGGPLGLEPLAGHGHADCLSFWLSVKGHPIVVDPGTYLYHSGGKWRSYFRSTAAHSTVVVDGADQSPMVSDFMFGRFYHAQPMQYEDSDERVAWAVEHDGYGRLKDPVIHRRTFNYLKQHRELIIEDLLTCEGTHSITSLIHLHPDCLVSLSGYSADVQCDDAELAFDFDKTWESIRIVRGQQDPVLGWYSPRFNEILESPTLVCSKTIRGTAQFTSVIRVRD